MKGMKTFVLIILLFTNLVIFSEEDIFKENNFTVFAVEEVQQIFGMINYLEKWEKNINLINNSTIDQLYKNYINKNNFMSLQLECFLLQTKNEKIREVISSYIKKNKLSDEVSQALLRLYASKKEAAINNGASGIRFNYKNQLYDENIDLFNINEISLFDDELGSMIFTENYKEINMRDIKTDKIDKNFYGIIYGGGTNSFTITFQRYENVDLENFKIQAFKNMDESTQMVELVLDGMLSNSGAEQYYLGMNYGPDILPGIERSNVYAYLYNSKIKKGYKITYFMNYSKSSNNYLIRKRIWNRLLFQALFNYLIITQKNGA
jgi:uncharacterized protein YqgQ